MQSRLPRIVLQGISPQVQGLQWESDKHLRIGRHQSQEIVVNDASIGREHAEVIASARGWMIRDQGAGGGTFLNGIRLDQKPRKLQLQDVIHCSQIAFRVTVLDEGIQGPPPLPNPEKLNIKTTGFLARIQASTQRTWEQGLKGLSPESAHLAQGKHFFTLVRAGYHLSRIDSLKELLQSILDDSVTVFKAQHGAVFLFDESVNRLTPKVLSSLQGATLISEPVRSAGGAPALDRLDRACHNIPQSAAFSQTLVERCFSKGESILCSDAHSGSELQTGPANGNGPMSFIICALLRSPRRKLGVLYLSRGGEGPFTKEDLDLADALAASISTGIESAQLVEKHREPFLVKAAAFVHRALKLREPSLGLHLDRVQLYSSWLAEELALPASERQLLSAAACLHDLGKLVAPDAMVRGNGDLAALNEQLIKGEELAEGSADMEPVLPIIRGRHEHWDGTGFPKGLAGEDIPLLARIIAVADAFDTLMSDHPPRTWDEALAALSAAAGKQFDPKLVQIFLRLRSRIQKEITPK